MNAGIGWERVRWRDRANTKTVKVLLMMAAFVIVLLAFSLTNSGTAQAYLNYGPITQYPSTGGKWQYGFWNAKVRSYYTVNRCHGSTVNLNGSQVRSANTAAGRTSIAQKAAVQSPGADDRYYYRVC